MKSNRFVDNLPIYDLCLRSVTYKSRGGKGGVHHGILKYDQLCKIHLWVLNIKFISTYCQHLRLQGTPGDHFQPRNEVS